MKFSNKVKTRALEKVTSQYGIFVISVCFRFYWRTEHRKKVSFSKSHIYIVDIIAERKPVK